MCLIVFDWQPDQPDWLALCANRDEFYRRPTIPLSRWVDYPTIIAGRDLEQGGSWLGITDDLRFAAVTNIRRPDLPQGRRSRGALVADFLASSQTPEAAARALQREASEYGLFNILFGTPNDLWYVRNYPTPFCQRVSPGRHTLSNEHLDSAWPKSALALTQLNRWQERGRLWDDMGALLNHRERFPDEQLPDTGMPLALEQSLSPQFMTLRERQYGTRCTTHVMGMSDGLGNRQAAIREIGWDSKGQQGQTRVYRVGEGHRVLAPLSE